MLEKAALNPVPLYQELSMAVPEAMAMVMVDISAGESVAVPLNEVMVGFK